MEALREGRRSAPGVAKPLLITPEPGAVYRDYTRHKVLVIALVAGAVLILAIVAMGLGSARLSPLEVLEILLGWGGQRSAQIVLNIRLPRVLAAILAGAGPGRDQHGDRSGGGLPADQALGLQRPLQP